jgi:hypothetical protein
VPVVISELVAGNPIEGLAEDVYDFGAGLESSASEFIFDLREGLFDGIEDVAVRRQEEEAGAALGEGVGKALSHCGWADDLGRGCP